MMFIFWFYCGVNAFTVSRNCGTHHQEAINCVFLLTDVLQEPGAKTISRHRQRHEQMSQRCTSLDVNTRCDSMNCISMNVDAKRLLH